MRKIYIVPNLVTTGNMFCGFYSIVAAMQGEITTAAWAILAAAVFDMLDGRIARLAKATSEFGVQYDSLSDLISFGMAPAILLFQASLAPFGRLGWLAAFLYLVCAALRLARFNVNTGVVPKGYFQGVPSPMSAGLVATFFIFNQATGWPAEDATIVSRENISLLLTFGVATLMVTTLRFPSFKELNWRSRASFGYLMIGVLALILMAVKPEITLFLILSTYTVAGLVWNGVRWVKGSARASAHAESPRV